ncbi:recombination protein O N-terminal domain-containing protein [Ideonella sp. DXS22W]|uniref:DNA repair protein RecO n=1 Tax=Pseudaquabacterium inlustre TaxID=2984192 RepID=A0ABU9CDZ1_9BURK
MSRPVRRTSSTAGVQLAFVLHQWDWSETSLILDLFTREQGRVAAVAKGAKRPYSQLRPVLMPFQRVQVTLGRSKAEKGGDGGGGSGGGEGSEIVTLRAAEYAGAGRVLPPGQLIAGFYLNELLLKLLARDDPHEAVFDAYTDTLQALAEAADDEAAAQAALRAFELLLLREIGVLPGLELDTTTQDLLQPGRRYRLLPEAGLVRAGRDELAALDGAQWLVLEAALAARALGALRLACGTGLAALRPQLRAQLHYHLGSPQLRTRQMMLDVRRLLDGPGATPVVSPLTLGTATEPPALRVAEPSPPNSLTSRSTP